MLVSSEARISLDRACGSTNRSHSIGPTFACLCVTLRETPPDRTGARLELNLHPLDVRSEFSEFIVDHLVPAIDMVNTINLRLAVG